MRKIIALSFMLIATVQFAQDMPEIVPPSPTAASLAQFADVPVSEYTGLPNISVPIYTAKSGDLTLPISLNYHGGGIKAAQEASWVGLGWSLSAGGTISRVIKGHDDLDDFSTGGSPYIYSADVPDVGASEVEFNSYYTKLIYEKDDSQPDIFFYNVGNLSGKFVIEKPENSTDDIIIGRPIDAKAVKIEYHRNARSWFITDSMGAKYYFHTAETTNTYSHSSDSSLSTYISLKNELRHNGGLIPDTNVTSWYLDEITSPTSNSKITFEYENNLHNTKSQIRLSQLDSKVLIHNSLCQSFTNDPAYNIGGSLSARSNTGSIDVTRDVYLSRINFSNGYVEFNTSDRIDMESIDNNQYQAQKLDDINVYNYSGSQIVSANLDLGYFTGGSSTDEIPEYYRLRLDGVSVNDKNYQFNYNDPGNSSTPSKITLGIDHWGYFNNARNSSLVRWARGSNSVTTSSSEGGTLIAGSGNYYFYDSNGVEQKTLINGANRNPSEEHTKYFILEEIILPTGGSHKFNWEPNEYFSLENTELIRKTFSVTSSSTPPYDQTMVVSEKEFEVGSGDVSDVNIDALVQKMSNYVPNITSLPQHPKVSYYKKENGQWVFKGDFSNFTYLGIYGNSDSNINMKYSFYNDLDEGKYKLVMSHLNSLRTSFTISFDEEETEYNVSVPSVGLRIKNIEMNDGIKTINKKYEYLLEGSNMSSGVSMGDPKYQYVETFLGTVFYGNDGYSCDWHSKYILGSSNSILPLSYTGDSFVGYSCVSTSYEGDTNQGETVSEFINIKPASPYIHTPPGFPVQKDIKNGKPLRTKIKNSEGVTIELTSYIYKTDNDYRKNTPGMFIYKSPFPDIYTTAIIYRPIPVGTSFNRYNTYSDWCYLESETNTKYDLEGNNPIIITTNYSYENEDHLQLTKTETIKSDGKRIITEMVYPDDVATASTLQDNSTIEGGSLSTEAFDAIKRLKHPKNESTGLHHIGKAIQTTTYEDTNNDGIADANELLSIQRTNYKDWGNDFILPKDIQTLKGVYNSSTNKLEERIVFHDYYDTGKLQEVSKKEGTSIVYVWSHNNEYPIVKIENSIATIVEAIMATFQPVDPSDPSTIPSDMTIYTMSVGDKLRLQLPNAMVTTYTYKPLVGITSVTDPKGYTMYYEYDDANRLKHIKDADGNILSKNEYNYKQQ